MCCFVQQGDTSVPATPCNVLEMMRQHLEETDSKTISCAFSDSDDQNLLKYVSDGGTDVFYQRD